MLTDRPSTRRQPLPFRPRWWPRWYELIPEGMLAAALAIFLVDEPDAATSAFKSSRALALMVLVGAGWVAARIVLARLVPWAPARLAVFGAAAVAVVAVVVLPAYDNDVIVERFPGAIPAPDRPSPVAPRPTTAPGAALLRTGSLRGIDHRASGRVTIYRNADGRYVVGLEEFNIQPGPDYDVYVVPGSDRKDPQGGTRLDDLRGNGGTQFYDAPAGVELKDGAWSVLVWCQTFGVPVANATPA
jgi:hypothetical protein